MSKTEFNFNKAVAQLQAIQGLTGKDGVLKNSLYLFPKKRI